MYLFHNGTSWIFGSNIYSECPAGQYRIEPSATQASVSIIQIARGAGLLFNKPIAYFKKANGDSYASFAEFKAAYTGFFSASEVDLLATSANQDDILGKISQIVTGIAKTAIKAGYYAYGCTCRVDGSKIASLEKTVGVTISEDSDESITGVAMIAMEWQPFVNKVTSVTQTAAGDSITYWLKPL